MIRLIDVIDNKLIDTNTLVSVIDKDDHIIISGNFSTIMNKIVELPEVIQQGNVTSISISRCGKNPIIVISVGFNDDSIIYSDNVVKLDKLLRSLSGTVLIETYEESGDHQLFFYGEADHAAFKINNSKPYIVRSIKTIKVPYSVNPVYYINIIGEK